MGSTGSLLCHQLEAVRGSLHCNARSAVRILVSDYELPGTQLLHLAQRSQDFLPTLDEAKPSGLRSVRLLRRLCHRNEPDVLVPAKRWQKGDFVQVTSFGTSVLDIITTSDRACCWHLRKDDW